MILVQKYSSCQEALWEERVNSAWNATFLHSRRFLSYHRERFEDLSLMLLSEEKKLLGVFPAARSLSLITEVVSHPGATYGGIVHGGELVGEKHVEALEAILSYYRGQGLKSLLYKTIPWIYHRHLTEDERYSLFRVDAERVRCDLSVCVDLKRPLPLSSRRQRGLKKAARLGLEIRDAPERLAEYWDLLSENLQKRYAACPVHELGEMEELMRRLPGKIRLSLALLEGKVVAGVLFFKMPPTLHAQYIAASELGKENAALDRIFAQAIEDATREGFAYLDFGTNNEKEGRYLNQNLFQFKMEFGASPVVYEQYRIRIGDLPGL